MVEQSRGVEDRLTSHVAEWASLWGTEGLERRLCVSFSRRMRRSLGRCEPARRTVRLASWLQDDAAAALLVEVLCHEAAHVAVFELFGRGVRPHGPEWKQLVRTAGFEPRTRLDVREMPPSVAPSAVVWEHRCPVCHVRRVARRPMRRWRCARCRENGLEGRLEVRSLPMEPSP